jgi:hypothetical protein
LGGSQSSTLISLKRTLSLLSEEVTPYVHKGIWFQNNSAPIHFSFQLHNSLNNRILGTWISHESQVVGSLHSPALKPLDASIWTCIMEHIYAMEVQVIVYLINNILIAVSDIRGQPGKVARVRGYSECPCRELE